MFGSRTGNLQLLVRPKSPEVIKAAMDDATVAMRIERRLRPKEPRQLRHVHLRHAARHLPQATNGIFAVLVGVVALSLVVGGIVIMNIMLMVVSERTREIGLRKALGARRRDIIWQILTESVTLSTMGGFTAPCSGSSLAVIISKLTPLPAAVQLWSVAIGIGITAFVGLFFGLYPACARRSWIRSKPAARVARQTKRDDNHGRHPVRAARGNRRDVARYAAHEQDALGVDRARGRHRHHVDCRHDLADSRLRRVAARLHPRARPEHGLGPKFSASPSPSGSASWKSRAARTSRSRTRGRSRGSVRRSRSSTCGSA